MSPVERYRSLKHPRVVGLMSGTSADGIDAVLVEIDRDAQRLTVLRQSSLDYTAELRQRLFALFEDRASVRELARMNVILGEEFARAALQVLDGESADLIASHGQTVAHLPGEFPPATLQVGEPAVIAARTGCLTVADFRPADLALGGQGAPLVPFFDAWLLGRHAEVDRVTINIGGMANLSWIPADGGPVLGWDTGPGNVLVDALAEIFTGQAMDPEGQLAARGQVLEPMLDRLLAHSYFHQTGPKSTGREAFGRELAASLASTGQPLEGTLRFAPVSSGPALQGATLSGELARSDTASSLSQRDAAPDLLRTAVALTAESLARSLATVVRGPFEAVVGGGGVRNPVMMEELRVRLGRLGMTALRTFDEFGVPASARECAAFAVMGHETVWGRPSALPSVTGASRPAVLGKLCFPSS